MSQVRRSILTFPGYSYYLWLTKAYVTLDNLELKVLPHQKYLYNNLSCDVCVIAIQLKSSRPIVSSKRKPNIFKNSLCESSKRNNLLPIKEFLILLIKGEMFGFISPKNSTTNKIIYH